MEAFGVAGEGEFRGGVGEQMGDGHLAADGGDVDDGGAAAVVAIEGRLRKQVGKGGLGGVEGGEEVVLHGGLEGYEGLIFNGSDLDDAGAVDEDVDAPEVSEGEPNHLFGGGRRG